ncbi:MAG: hypothetical protein RR359_05720 [Bacilli bacterium]
MKNFDQEKSNYIRPEKVYVFDDRTYFARNKATEVMSKYNGLSLNTYSKLVSYYKRYSDSIVEDTLLFLMNLLPAYYGKYEDCIDFINKHVILLFTNCKLLETRLACLHILGLEKDALENCNTLLTRNKIRDMYTVCFCEKISQDTNEYTSLDALGLKILIDKIIEQGNMNELNKRFCISSESFNNLRLNYRNFIKEQKDKNISLQLK